MTPLQEDGFAVHVHATVEAIDGDVAGEARARGLAELLDGTVELIESSSQGSTFRFTLSAPACAARG